MNKYNFKKMFLSDLGLNEDNFPLSFFEEIQDINLLLTSTELGYLSYWPLCDGKKESFCIKDLVGTDHQRYSRHSWIDSFLDLDRGDKIIQLLYENPKYWEDLKVCDNTDLGLIKYNDKYYIFSKAGGGNNRLITMKIMYLSLIQQALGNQHEVDRINKQFTFTANVRELPKDYTIPFIAIAMSEDLDEFDIGKKGDLYIVLKEFSDIILFEGDNTSLINYFKSLFNIDIYGEDVVNKRLSKLELGCQLSDKKHREVLEAILPSFKNFDRNGEVKKIV